MKSGVSKRRGGSVVRARPVLVEVIESSPLCVVFQEAIIKLCKSNRDFITQNKLRPM